MDTIASMFAWLMVILGVVIIIGSLLFIVLFFGLAVRFILRGIWQWVSSHKQK